MDIESRMINGVLVLRLEGPRLDAAGAVHFKDRIRELTATAPPRVVLDMANVVFMDSSGLGAVVAVMKQLGPDSTLELSGLTEAVNKVFQLTRMNTVFTIHADLDSAAGASDVA